MFNKEEIKMRYLERMVGMSKEERIQYLEDCKFNIDMIDRWTEEDKIYHNVIVNLLKEMKEDENND